VDEGEDEAKILKRDRKFMMDSEEEFDDYDVEDPIDQSEPAVIPPATMQYRPECIHKQFQPSCTPFVHGYRFLCWNNTGLITSRQDEGYCSVAVEFHDKNFHRPVHFIDEFGYTMGAIGKSGFILASPKDTERPSMLYISPLDSQERSAPWSISLAPEEDVMGVAIGAAKYAVVATSAGFLRTFSPTGLQGPIVNFPGSFVTMVAHANQLFLLTSDEFSSELVYTFYDLNGLAQLRMGHVGGRFRNTRLGWIGWSDNGIAGIFDEQMVLHICNADAGYVWQPWLECREQKEKKELVWPIGFTANDLLCLQLRSGDDHPEPVPRPMPTVIPMQIPLLGIDDPVVVSFEKALRAHTVFKSNSLRPEMADRESRKLQLVSDKHVLELIQLAIRADKPARVIELCPLFLMEKSWDMAVQLVRHNRLAQLADRIENLRHKTECKSGDKVEVPYETRVTPALGKTLRIPSQVAVESPSTTLANLTPIPFSLEAAQLKAEAPLFSLNQSAFDEPTQLFPETSIDSAPTALANPFAQLSFDTPRTEAKSRSFAEMMRTVQQAVEAPSPIKKARSEAPPVEKTKKQSELSLFTKCMDENIGGNE
jgi:chromosome transmission fidelity protein 4